MLKLGLVDDGNPSTSIITNRLVELGAVFVEPSLVSLGAPSSGVTISHGSRHIHSDTTIVIQVHMLLMTITDAALVHLVIGMSVTEDDWTSIDVSIDGTGTPAQLRAAIDDVWHNRIVPFEANLRLGKRAPRCQKAMICASNPAWPVQARRLIAWLTAIVSHQILRVDHIGSTSVSSLPAKDLLDIQVVVADLDKAAVVADTGRAAGFVHVPGPWDGTDRNGHAHPEHVLVDADPGRPVNINIRPVTAPIWRETIMFRDWLRIHPEGRTQYADLKRSLAARSDSDVNDYGIDKMPFISNALTQAEQWAADVNWNTIETAIVTCLNKD